MLRFDNLGPALGLIGCIWQTITVAAGHPMAAWQDFLWIWIVAAWIGNYLFVVRERDREKARRLLAERRSAWPWS